MTVIQISALRKINNPTDASVESLRAFPFLDSDAIINGLKAELPVYLAAAEDVNVLSEEQKVEWWHRQEERLPRWATAVKQVLLIQPSSADWRTFRAS